MPDPAPAPPLPQAAPPTPPAAAWRDAPGLYPAFVTPPPPPAQSPRPPLFLFEGPIEQDYSHPLWHEHHNTVPSVRTDVRGRATPDGKETWEPAAGPHDTVRSFVVRLLRLIDLLAPHFGPRNTPLRWYAIPAAWGGLIERELKTFPNLIPLLNHPLDRLASGRRAPFANRGIAANRAWTSEFLEDFAAELKFRRLPTPLAIIITSENGVGDDFGGHFGNPDVGWVPEALADPRADDPDHTIDGERTFKAFFDQARTLDDQPIPEYDHSAGWSNPPGRSPKNAESSGRYRAAMELLWDYARDRALGSLVRRHFPGESRPLVGEYQSACDSHSSPVRLLPGIWRHHMNGRFRADLQVPDWYGSWPSKVDDVEFATAGPGVATRRNWLRSRPIAAAHALEPAQLERRLALEIAKDQAEQHARAAPHAPIAPYITMNDGTGVSDLIEYCRHCRLVGATAFNVFMPVTAGRELLDKWKSVVEAVSR